MKHPPPFESLEVSEMDPRSIHYGIGLLSFLFIALDAFLLYVPRLSSEPKAGFYPVLYWSRKAV